MKKIIKGLLYDTETAELIFEDALNNKALYVTPGGNYFMLYNNTDITPRSEESAKEYLGENDADKYIEIWGNPEPINDFQQLMNSTIASLENACKSAIFDGKDIVLSTGIEHFTLDYQDQINLSDLTFKLFQKSPEIAWHSDDKTEPCKYYSYEDMSRIIEELQIHKFYHISYLRSLRIYVRTFAKESDLKNVFYGMPIPEEYKSDVLKDYESLL